VFKSEKTTVLRDLFLSFVLTFGLAYSISQILPFLATALTLGIIVVAAHEAGHYYSAWLYGGDPNIPLVVPIAVGVIGMTRVKNFPTMSSRHRRYVITAGPIAGTIAALSLLPYAILLGNTVLVLTTFGLVIMEVHGGTFGSDGKKWRRENNLA